MAFAATEVAAGLRLPEGPVALEDGSILICEVAGGTVVRLRDGASEVVADVGGGPNGAAIGPDGRLFVANNGGLMSTIDEAGRVRVTGGAAPDYQGGSIQAVDLQTGRFETVVQTCDGEVLSSPNDLVFDAVGGLYFTDSGKTVGRQRVIGSLGYVAPGASEAVRLASPLDAPNGVGLSPRGDRIYVSETITGRIWFWDLDGPGAIRPGHTARLLAHGAGGTLLHGFGGLVMLDSLAVDALGNVCVACLVRGAITVVTPDGRVEEIVRLPEHDPHVTNICFGGPDLRTAYVTCGGLGKVYAVEWPWPGLPTAFTC